MTGVEVVARPEPSSGAGSFGLTDALSEFVGHPSPRVLLPATAAALGLRAVLGQWRRRDLGIAAGILAFEPFTEWLIHVFILHLRPKTIRGRRLDPLLARKHREHHRDPKDSELVFVPMPVIKGVVPAAVVLWALAERRLRPALTGIATSYAMLTAYEWTHYLIHTAYRPRHQPYRVMWRTHRLHHYRNEHYWFGVTMHLGDRILRTYPEREAVPLSATARTLGVPA